MRTNPVACLAIGTLPSLVLTAVTGVMLTFGPAPYLATITE